MGDDITNCAEKKLLNLLTLLESKIQGIPQDTAELLKLQLKDIVHSIKGGDNNQGAPSISQFKDDVLNFKIHAASDVLEWLDKSEHKLKASQEKIIYRSKDEAFFWETEVKTYIAPVALAIGMLFLVPIAFGFAVTILPVGICILLTLITILSGLYCTMAAVGLSDFCILTPSARTFSDEKYLVATIKNDIVASVNKLKEEPFISLRNTLIDSKAAEPTASSGDTQEDSTPLINFDGALEIKDPYTAALAKEGSDPKEVAIPLIPTDVSKNIHSMFSGKQYSPLNDTQELPAFASFE